MELTQELSLCNYTEEVIDFNKLKKNDDFKKCMEYVSYMKKDPVELFPPIRHVVRFEIKNAEVELANTIRKCIIGELSIKSLEFDESDIDTDDKYILSDYLRKNIENIPINQDMDLDYLKTLKISLHCINKTIDLITIYSHDIIVLDKGKPIELFARNVPITVLHPCNYLKISNITISEGITYTNAGKYSAIAASYYEILENEKTATSLISNPKHFKLGYTTYGNIIPKHILDKCLTTLTGRLNIILNELMAASNQSEISYYSNLLRIEEKDDIVIFYIENEFWSFSRLIAKYCMLLDSNIKFVAPGIIHPSANKCFIKIIHSTPVKLLCDTVIKILKDIHILLESPLEKKKITVGQNEEETSPKKIKKTYIKRKNQPKK